MKQRFAGILFLCVLSLALAACTPTGQNPLGSSGSGSGSGGGGGGNSGPLPTYALLTGSTLGTWAGFPLHAEQQGARNIAIPVPPLGTGPGGSTQITVQPLANSPTVFTDVPYLLLAVDSTNPNPQPSFPAGYMARGKIEFDLQIDFPSLSNVANVYVYWGKTSCAQHTYTIPQSDLAGAMGAFVHFSLPLSSFTGASSPCGNSTLAAIAIGVDRIGTTNTSGGFSISNIQWVAP